MLVGLVGKPNVGKSTFFTAATLAPAETGNYPFTTIEPNRGVAYVRHACPHPDFDLAACAPKHGACRNGTRWVPVEVLDVAGLVKGAHEGKGLGNQFLDNLRTASALVHVVDASGGTDAEGSPVDVGAHDPLEDVTFLEAEIDHWIAGIVGKNFERQARSMEQTKEKPDVALYERLSGLGITLHDVTTALQKSGVDTAHPTRWSADDLVHIAQHVRRVSKPIIVAANKVDKAPPDLLKNLEAVEGVQVVPVSAEGELALRKAAEAGVIRYEPGDADFDVVDDAKLSAPQLKALEYIRTHVLQPHGGTGVQRVLETAVYDLLDRIVVFPVEDDTHLTDKEGTVLPDAHIVPKGTTARELAYAVHTDLGDHFIRAVDARTKRVIGADHELADGDVVRVVAGK